MIPSPLPVVKADKVSKTRELAFDVVGQPETVQELTYVMRRMCQIYVATCKDATEARTRVEEALSALVQEFHKADEVIGETE